MGSTLPCLRIPVITVISEQADYKLNVQKPQTLSTGVTLDPLSFAQGS